MVMSKLQTDQMNSTRVCALMDVDAFEVQVYLKHYNINPEPGKMYIAANIQNRILAANAEAKAVGISRDIKYVTPALKKSYPDLIILRAPMRKGTNGKPDLAVARRATDDIISVIKKFCKEIGPEDDVRPTFEYSSRDEFYLDFSKIIDKNCSTHVYYYQWIRELLWPKAIMETKRGPKDIGQGIKWRPSEEQELRMFHGLVFGSELVHRIKVNTGFQVSVGIGPNKFLAKLACGHNKPAGVTALPYSGYQQISQHIEITSVAGFKGNKGKAIIETFRVINEDGIQRKPEFLADLIGLEIEELVELPTSVENPKPIGLREAEKLYMWINGFCNQPIIAKDGAASANTSQSFRNIWMSLEQLQSQMEALAEELMERSVEERVVRNREAVSVKCVITTVTQGGQEGNSSRRLDFDRHAKPIEIVEELLAKFDFDSDWKGKVKKIAFLAEPFNPLLAAECDQELV